MKIHIYIFIAILYIVFTLGSTVVLAHPGRTDASGGHTCRTNCPNWGLEFGEYHYHRAKALPQSKPPIKSKFGENGTGYTIPAPEYQIPIKTIPKNTNSPGITTEKQPQRGFWQWLSGLFK